MGPGNPDGEKGESSEQQSCGEESNSAPSTFHEVESKRCAADCKGVGLQSLIRQRHNLHLAELHLVHANVVHLQRNVPGTRWIAKIMIDRRFSARSVSF